MHKDKVLGGLILLAVLIIIGGFFYSRYTHRIVVSEFIGTVTQKSPTLLTMEGHYTADNHPEFQSGDPEHVQVTLTPQTVYRKISIHLPTIAQVQAQGGTYRLEDQPRDIASGSYDDIASQVIAIHATGNIHQKISFTAKTIEYALYIYPQE